MKNSLVLVLAIGISVVRSGRVLEDVISTAFCIAGCSNNEQCWHNCHKTVNNRTNVPHIAKPSNSNISLQCRDVNRLVLKQNPGLYVIETQSKNGNFWTHPKISNETIYESRNLSANNEYRYRVRRVSTRGVAQPDTTSWLQTHSENFVPQEVKNASIDNIIERENKPGQLQTYLNIVPADDLNCAYHVVHWGEEHYLYHYQLDAAREFRVKLSHLRYEKNNTVYVISRNEKGLQQSENFTLTFTTPSCLNFRKNLSICTPAPIEGIEINELASKSDNDKKSLDLKVNWCAPQLYPDNYTIIAQPLDCDNCSVEINIPGNETTATIFNLPTSHEYTIGVIVESEGGVRLQSKTFTVASLAPDESSTGI